MAGLFVRADKPFSGSPVRDAIGLSSSAITQAGLLCPRGVFGEGLVVTKGDADPANAENALDVDARCICLSRY